MFYNYQWVVKWFWVFLEAQRCLTMLWRYATPFGLTSEYGHPAEILFLGFPTMVSPHLITLWIWMVLRVLETVEAHCGYHFPWSSSNFLSLYGGWVSFSFTWHQPFSFGYFVYFSIVKIYISISRADFHDYHHHFLYTKSGNYSSTFIYMDR